MRVLRIPGWWLSLANLETTRDFQQDHVKRVNANMSALVHS